VPSRGGGFGQNLKKAANFDIHAKRRELASATKALMILIFNHMNIGEVGCLRKFWRLGETP
jgi:hypothetical protein